MSHQKPDGVPYLTREEGEHHGSGSNGGRRARNPGWLYDGSGLNDDLFLIAGQLNM